MSSHSPIQVGITGGIGSGKTLLCKIFSALGVPVYDADTRAKWLTQNDPTIKRKIINKFGAQSFENNTLNRTYLAQTVFHDQEKLNTLNSIIHPAVGRDYKDWVKKQRTPYVLKEAALMFESGSYKTMDKVINVSAPRDLRISRVLQRDQFRGEEQVKAIINKQLSEKERANRADYIIHNNGKMMVIPQVLSLHQVIQKLSIKKA